MKKTNEELAKWLDSKACEITGKRLPILTPGLRRFYSASYREIARRLRAMPKDEE